MPAVLDPEDVALLERAAGWAGMSLSGEQVGALARLAGWLVDEGIPAGGIGPGEGDTIMARHLGDSLVFAGAILHPPAALMDVGSGVGLPGLPLAILYPQAAVRLVDRSSRRCRLARRGARVLGLENVEVVEADSAVVAPPAEVVVARGAIPPGELLRYLPRLVAPGGRAVIGGSTVGAPELGGYEIVEVPAEILGAGRWLLVWEG